MILIKVLWKFVNRVKSWKFDVDMLIQNLNAGVIVVNYESVSNWYHVNSIDFYSCETDVKGEKR